MPSKPALDRVQPVRLVRLDDDEATTTWGQFPFDCVDRMDCFLKRTPVQEISPGCAVDRERYGERDGITNHIGNGGHLARFITAGGLDGEAFCCEPKAS